jgi:hypothetical protein
MQMIDADDVDLGAQHHRDRGEVEEREEAEDESEHTVGG